MRFVVLLNDMMQASVSSSSYKILNCTQMQERADVLEQLGELKNQEFRQLNVLLLGGRAFDFVVLMCSECSPGLD